MQNLIAGQALYYCRFNASKDKDIHLLFISSFKRVSPAYIPQENILNLKNTIQEILAWKMYFYYFTEAVVPLEADAISSHVTLYNS